MKKVSAKDVKENKNSDNCIAFEYPLGDPDINAVVVKLHGRYPDSGQVVNTECKELIYVLDGQGQLVVEGKALKLGKGDVALIEPGEKYYWQGELTMFMPCTPAWTPEQHKLTP